MKKIKKGNFLLFFDDDIFEILKNENFVIGKNKNMFYVRVKQKYVHRIVMNAEKGVLIDHINGNGLDNRKCNLRVISRQGNKANQKFNGNKKTSKYIGVGKSKNKFRVCVKHEGKNKYLGSFENEKDAALAYDKFALEKFGISAILNFPFV